MKLPFYARLFLLLGLGIALVYILVTLKSVLLPLTLATLFAFALRPTVTRWQKRMPKALAILIPLIGMVLFLAAIVTGLSFIVRSFILNIPGQMAAIQANLGSLQMTIQNITGLSGVEQISWIRNHTDLAAIGAGGLSSIFSATTGTFAIIGLSFIFTFFLLYYRNQFDRAITAATHDAYKDEINSLKKSVSSMMPSYLRGVFLVMTIIAVLSSLGFWLIGVPSPIFFGVFVAVLNLIPYVGTTFGFGMVVLYSLLVMGLPVALLSVAVFAIVQFTDNNFLTPQLAAGQVSVNPLAAILGIILGGMLWGVAGMIIAIPILGIIKLIADTFAELRPLALAIGTEGNEQKELG
jgi:predicted PurR-regulated permease PerM